MKAFTLLESLIVVGIIIVLIGIAMASYRRVQWTTTVTSGAVKNRGRMNQAVHDGKFRSQKQFDAEQERIRRQTEIGLTQGK